MTNSFCRYLNNGYIFSRQKSNKILVSPCCFFEDSVELDHNFDQNYSKFRNITDWTPNCEHCRRLELVGQQSLRQTALDWIPEVDHNHPITIDVHLDRSCNAACVICGEHQSSLWFKEKQKLTGGSIRIDPVDSDINQAMDNIFQHFDFSHLRYVKFHGGEPLFTDTHIKFLRRLPCPENITVHYTTNGSIFPNKETLDIWQRFSTIIFAASIDGTDEQFDYLRWPLPWKKVSENLISLKNLELHNLMFRVEFTANFLNVWYFDRLEQWIKENLSSNAFGDPTELNIHYYFGDIVNVEYMSEDLKQMVMAKYPENHRMHNLAKTTCTQPNLVNFLEFAKVWDTRRGLNWQQAFSEIKHTLPFTD